MPLGSSNSRRDFLEALTPRDGDAAEGLVIPTGSGTLRVGTRAMACEFSVIMNPGAHERVMAVGDVLEMIHDIESWLSIYKSSSEISFVNRRAFHEDVHVRRPLLELLQLSERLWKQTAGAFDIAAGAQVQLWRQCRNEKRLPTNEETEDVQERSGSQHLRLEEATTSVRFSVDGLQLDPGAIGKGYALDEAAAWLKKLRDCPNDFLLHGGHSSLVAQGCHADQSGWPVGIGNPLLTKKRLGTVLLKNQAMSTSGSNIQFYRHEGRRYGHILDPRTAQPVEGMLSVTVFAESAAIADALSTAFFVLGVENAQKCCDNLPNVGVIMVPFPNTGAKVTPTVIGVPEDQIFWDKNQVDVTGTQSH